MVALRKFEALCISTLLHGSHSELTSACLALTVWHVASIKKTVMHNEAQQQVQNIRCMMQQNVPPMQSSVHSRHVQRSNQSQLHRNIAH